MRNLLCFAIVICVPLCVVRAGEKQDSSLTPAGADHTDNRLLTNIDTLKPVASAPKNALALGKLEAELATLWDWTEEAKRPLNPEIVYSSVANGYRTEGIYINGYGDANGQDRIFFYYSRPEQSDKKCPVYIQLTGGGEADKSLWLARTCKCAVIDIEWRGAKNKFRSKWAAGGLGSMKELGSLKDNMVFRLVSGIRRAIDFAAQQPGTDLERLGCGGGSMGGYYTLLTAGVDSRIRFGMDELGAGYLAQTDSSLGAFELSPEQKAIWIKAFDPYSHAQNTRAKMLVNLSANDYFFWLGDGLKNYEALAGEKTLCISANFNHGDGAYGATKHNEMAWLPYAMGREANYPAIDSFTQAGAVYRVRAQSGASIQGASLYWSPGRNLVWPARYWMEVPATLKDGVWQAEIPARYAALERCAFMTLRGEKGKAASTVPVFTAGVNPQETAGNWWPSGQALDVETGLGSWRPVGPNRHSGVSPAKVSKHESGGICIVPNPESKAFSLVNGSIVLAAASAKMHKGLRIDLDAAGVGGEMTVSLVRNFSAVQAQCEFASVVRYGQGKQRIEIPWSEFKCKTSPQENCFPFDNLRIDGKQADGRELVIQSVTLY